MGFKICMNSSCGTSRTTEWKKGWPLRSGGYADLCSRCGSAYESSAFCDTFHSEESGWRECCICSKRLHCGCVASSSLLQLLEYGGVGCASCTKNSGLHSVRKFGALGDEIANGFGALSLNNGGCCAVESRLSEKNPRGEDFVDLCSMLYTQPRGLIHNLLTQPVKSVRKEMGEEIMHTNGEMDATFQNVTQPHVGPTLVTKIDNPRPLLDIRDTDDPLCRASVNMTLGEPPSKVKFELPYTNGVADGTDQSRMPPQFQQGPQSHDRPIGPKLLKNGQTLSSESNKTTAPQARVARPPAEGRGKNHLLPRYWPRITDQELQQLSGDLKSTIVPLFEKVLSASDASRIGRLVLPKACAEAYFPPISQSEGLPLRIQDVKGNEWTFQFRFWPNNNSRMYVLEGVTPCIQTMQLRAGDTVTFSRIDPGGKLVMGFRKATNSDTQDTETSALNNGIPPEILSNTSFTENQPSAGTNGPHQLPKGNKDPHLDNPSENIKLPDGDIGENYRSKGNEESMQQQVINSEKKRSRNIGKNKRLLIHNEDALELRLTWEEAQDLLRPPTSLKPTVVTIEDHEFEEYDEPPVFGKKTIYTAQSSGGQEQWAQCDDCSKWRRLPGDVLLPPKWICADNVWDSSRCSCSADAEISPKELENLLRVRRDSKKRRVVEAQKLVHEREPSGLDALASAAALGEKLGEPGESSVGATTKHPRHRPGCSCIVCIQPPSGKGKHKPTCTCNVCMTVKRRFKTLMLRKKRRQSEREAELAGLAQKESDGNKDAVQTHGVRNGCSENEGSEGRTQAEAAEINSGHIDLNCHPVREDIQVEEVRVSMTSSRLVEADSMPLPDHIKHIGEVDGYRDQEDTQHPELFSQSTHQDRHISELEFLASLISEQKTAED